MRKDYAASGFLRCGLVGGARLLWLVTFAKDHSDDDDDDDDAVVQGGQIVLPSGLRVKRGFLSGHRLERG